MAENARVIALRPTAALNDAAAAAHEAFTAHLGRCKLAARTKQAYARQAVAYLAWLDAHAADHPDAFADVTGAEGAVTAWRARLLRDRLAPATVNQALAAVDLLYDVRLPRLRLKVERVTVPRPGEPNSLSLAEQKRLERAADRRGVRDAAIVALLGYTGARVEELARVDLEDVVLTARTGTIRLLGKGDQVRTVPIPQPARERISALLRTLDRTSGPLLTGQRGRLTVSGITQVVLAAGDDASLPGLRPHRLRHTYATRLRRGGIDLAVIQTLLGHASLETTARYFRPGQAELATAVEHTFSD